MALVVTLSAFGQKNDLIVIEKNQVIEQDFYASGSVIEISGICKKDVYVAASQVVIDGVIEGDLICFCGSLQITGRVEGSLRAIAGQTLIAGSIGKNTTIASAAFTATPSAQFLSNAFIAASTADIAGVLAEDLFMGASNMRYSALSQGNLHLYAGTIRIGSKAQVEGYLEYSSPNAIDVQKGAMIKKEIIEKKGTTQFYSKSMTFNRVLLGSKFAAVLMNLFFTLLLGLAIIKIWPTFFIRSLANLKMHFFKSVVQGFLFVLLIPIIGALLLITILGIPIAVTLIAFSILGLYTAKIHTLYYLADRIKHKYLKRWKMISLYMGLCVVYFVLQLIPGVGISLSVICTLAGLGASVYFPKIARKV